MNLRFVLGGVLTGLGVGLFIVARTANNYHSEKFQEHTDRLGDLADEGRDKAICREIQRFSDDHSVDLAITLMSWAELLWFPCLAFGLAILYTEWPA
jgi:hypothetical protein